MTHASTTESSPPSTSTTVTPSNQYAIPRMSTPTSGPQVFAPSFIPEFSPITENRRVVDQMRRWNCHFEGKDVYSFLEIVDELRTAYGVSDEQLLQGLPELLRGDALQWYRNLDSECHTWAHFDESLRGFYLSPAERRLLIRQVAERVQKPQEPVPSYVTALRTLMRRRGGYPQEE